MNDRHAPRHAEQDYGRDIRLALVAALLLLIAGFRAIRLPEVRSFQPRPMPVFVIDRPFITDPGLPATRPRTRPGLAVPVPGGSGDEPAVSNSPVVLPGLGSEPEIPVVEIGRVVEFPPRPVDLPAPAYPELCRNAGITGTAVLKLLVEPDSSVSRAEILRSSDNRLLDAAALAAAARARFTPGRQGIQPVRVWVAVPYVFRLD
ncbi:MAG: TonB family protein [bacterium]